MRFPTNKTLGKIAVYFGVGSISAVMYMRYKIQDRVRQTDYFRLALQTLRQHKGAVRLLGEPIKEMGFELSDAKNNHCDSHSAQFEVKVKGSKDRGTIFFWASHNMDEGWLLDRLELEIKSQPDKRFLIKKLEEQTNETNA